MYARNVEEVIKEQLSNPRLAPFIQWDARRMYKWNGSRWVQFVEDEPCTGSLMWDVQVCICSFSCCYSDNVFTLSRKYPRQQNLWAYTSTQTRINSHPLERNRDTLLFYVSLTLSQRSVTETMLVVDVLLAFFQLCVFKFCPYS